MRTAFTLIEMIIVLAITALMLALVMPKLNTNNLKTAAKNVENKLYKTRVEAIETGEKVELELEFEEDIIVEMPAPIICYPNGRCSNGTIIIKNSEMALVLKTRSITGDIAPYNQDPL